MIKMMNVIRSGNSLFRANSKLIYSQTVTPQCSFCSSSESDDGNQKKNAKGLDDSKKKHEKPIDQKKKSKFMKLKESRNEQGLTALHDLFNNTESYSKNKDVNVKKKESSDNEADDKSNVESAQSLQDILKSSDISGKKIEIPTPPKKEIKPGSSKELLSKVMAAAVELGGDVEATKEELLSAYRSTQAKPSKYPPRDQKFSSHRTESSEGTKETPTTSETGIKSIFHKEKLGIFTENVKEEEPQLKMWHKLNEMTLVNMTMTPAKNYFEQLILWTHQGKLWHFPIDNEQGMDEEKRTDFTEHIFLDVHLDPWCPKTGPLRHFMELVTVGLSKNPYLSVQEKKDHIFWYRDYFESKRKLLTEVGAFDSVSPEKIEEK